LVVASSCGWPRGCSCWPPPGYALAGAYPADVGENRHFLRRAAHSRAGQCRAGGGRELLRAVGAPVRFVEVAEASAGPDRLVLVVGEGVRVVAAPLEAIAFALRLGLPIRCPDTVIEADGVPVGPTDSVGGMWTLAGATPVSAPGSGDGLDPTDVLEAITPAGDDDPVEPVVQPPAGVAILQIRQGPGAGAVFALDADVVGCGRDRGNQIVLDGATVSRKHAEFRRQGSRYVVCDLGSLNGTYVNGERVELAVLAVGDQIRIGRYVLFFATG
jgi:hypothetical protein